MCESERNGNCFPKILDAYIARGKPIVPTRVCSRTQRNSCSATREDVNATQKRIFYLNYGAGCRAESNPVFVRWSDETTNELR